MRREDWRTSRRMRKPTRYTAPRGADGWKNMPREMRKRFSRPRTRLWMHYGERWTRSIAGRLRQRRRVSREGRKKDLVQRAQRPQRSQRRDERSPREVRGLLI